MLGPAEAERVFAETVAQGAYFANQEHTARHFRSESWLPGLADPRDHGGGRAECNGLSTASRWPRGTIDPCAGAAGCPAG